MIFRAVPRRDPRRELLEAGRVDGLGRPETADLGELRDDGREPAGHGARMARQPQQLTRDDARPPPPRPRAPPAGAGKHLSAKRTRLWCDDAERAGPAASVVTAPTRWRTRAPGTCTVAWPRVHARQQRSRSSHARKKVSSKPPSCRKRSRRTSIAAPFAHTVGTVALAGTRWSRCSPGRYSWLMRPRVSVVRAWITRSPAQSSCAGSAENRVGPASSAAARSAMQSGASATSLFSNSVYAADEASTPRL